MPRRLDRIFAISGTLTFVLGWAVIIYLMTDPDPFYVAADREGQQAAVTAIAYGPEVMLAAAAQWFLAIYAYRKAKASN